MRLLQLLEGGRRVIEHATEFRHLSLGVDNVTLTLRGLTLTLRGLLESRQQELLALGKIVGKLSGIIHNASCCNESPRL